MSVILEAAAHILETKGLVGYNTNTIANRAGVSIGSIYQYFPNKDAITAALVLKDAEIFQSKLEFASEGLDINNVAASAFTLIDVAVRHQLERPQLARIIDIEQDRLPLELETTKMLGCMSQMVSSLLVKRYNISDEQALIIAQDIIAITRGMVDGAGMRGETDIDNLRNRVLKAVLGYIEDLDENTQ